MEILITIGFWILWCVLGVKITASKGRGEVTGFWLGLLLGPLGVLIALFLSRKSPDDEVSHPPA